MDTVMRQELTKICVLAYMKQASRTEAQLLSAINERFGLEEFEFSFSLSDLCDEGYLVATAEAYTITPKGLDALCCFMHCCGLAVGILSVLVE